MRQYPASSGEGMGVVICVRVMNPRAGFLQVRVEVARYPLEWPTYPTHTQIGWTTDTPVFPLLGHLVSVLPVRKTSHVRLLVQ